MIAGMRSLTAITRDERGFTQALELALFTALIVMPVFVLVIGLPTWWERSSLGRQAAAEAARAVVVADSFEAGAVAADELVAQTAATHAAAGDVELVGLDGRLARGSSVTATVTVDIPAIPIPMIATTPAFTRTFTATELVDHYRHLSAPDP